MLAVPEALARILAEVTPLEAREIPLAEALGLVLAQEVTAHEQHPPFDNSAVDGFAVRYADGPGPLELIGEIPAGTVPDFRLEPGQSAAIMTGAMLPEGADACAMVEDSRKEGTRLFLSKPVSEGENVRRAGEHLKAGQVVLTPGRVLRPGDIGLAASLGYPKLHCIPKARVAVLSTGSELVEPGLPLAQGQIRDSNSYAIQAQILTCGGLPVRMGPVADDPEALEPVLRHALEVADVLITSAGVSVGDHDHVRPLLEKLGGQLSFWRIKMRPGRPLAFGKAGRVPMFGLPGNPVSSMVTFEMFVRPALDRLMGRTPVRNPARAVLATEFSKKPGLTWFLRARLDADGRAHPSKNQGSHILSSMVEADGLVVIPEEAERLEAGTEVDFLPLTYS